MTWSNQVTMKFIELYRNEPAIWNPQCAEHKDKVLMKKAWARIGEAMNMPVNDLKRKKEALMATFRLCYKKKLQAITQGKGDEFSTSWVFYNVMEEFLKDVYDVKYINNASDNTLTYANSDEEEEYLEDFENDDYEEKIFLSECPNTTPKVRKRSAKNPLEYDEDNTNTSKILKNSTHFRKDDEISKIHNNEEDDCDLYARLLAKKLRRFNENERHEIMYEIDGLVLSRRRNRSDFNL